MEPSKYSDVSKFYRKRKVDKDVIFECKGCKKLFKCWIKEDGTSTLRYHMENCRMRKGNRKIAKEMLVAAVIRHDLPSSFLEFEGVRAFINYLGPDLPRFSKQAVVYDINKLYLKEKAKLKQALANIRSRVCLTVDVWTSCTNERYFCLAARFVDEDWKLNCKVLNVDRVDSSNIEGTKIVECLTEWGIHGKVFSLTLNNALRNYNVVNFVKKQLLNDLLCGGEFFHGSCFGDILNLIVQNGFKLCDEVLFKIRKSLKYLSGSESRMKKFANCVSQISEIDTSVDLRLDAHTSWSSTYLMLDTAIKYKKAFASFRAVDYDYEWCPTDEEWNRGEKLREFLGPYYAIYNLIRNPSTPASDLFMQVFFIEKRLKEKLSSEDATISGLCRSVIEKFDEYWNLYTTTLAFAFILHPKVKLIGLEILYSKVESDPVKRLEKISLVKSSLYKLFEDYDKASESSSSESELSPFSDDDPSLKEYIKYEREQLREQNAGKSQLDRYLEQGQLRYLPRDLDVFKYWKSESGQWPGLALMACDVLATPITTVASESGFSIGAHMLTEYRNCMVPENVQDLICTRNWLHGFESNDDDCLRIKTTLSDGGSNDRLSDKGSDGRKSVDDDC